MLIIPAVDVMGGKCVRLVQGDPAKSKVYFETPLTAIRTLQDQGADLIHLIDLDAALDIGHNVKVMKKILKGSKIKVQIGGGVRTLKKAETFLELGAARVIFGTAAILSPELVKKAIHRYGSTRIAIAIDEKGSKVVFKGWKDFTDRWGNDSFRYTFEVMTETGAVIKNWDCGYGYVAEALDKIPFGSKVIIKREQKVVDGEIVPDKSVYVIEPIT